MDILYFARFGMVAGGQFAGNEFQSIFTVKEMIPEEIWSTVWVFHSLLRSFLLFLNIEID